VTTDAAVRKEIAELRARGDDAADRERLKKWRASKQAPTNSSSQTGTKAAADEGGRWLTGLDLSLMRFHQQANQRRGRLRAAHRMPFVQCRKCDELRRAAVASKQKDDAPTP